MSTPQTENHIIHPSMREMLREADLKQKRIVEIKAEVKQSFAPQMAESHGIWHPKPKAPCPWLLCLNL